MSQPAQEIIKDQKLENTIVIATMVDLVSSLVKSVASDPEVPLTIPVTQTQGLEALTQATLDAIKFHYYN